MDRRFLAIFLYPTLLFPITALALPAKPEMTQEQNLQRIQVEIRRLEKGIDSEKMEEASINSELAKLDKLLKLQSLETQLSKIEQDKLGERIMEMQVRRDSLEQVVQMRKRKVRELLSALPSLEAKNPFQRLGDDNLINLFLYRETVDRMMKMDRRELVALRDQLLEVSELGSRLVEERERLISHVEDLKEKQAVLALNKNLKKELLKKNQVEQNRLLKAYQLAKAAEGELEAMLTRLNSDAERTLAVTQMIDRSKSFSAQKGRLPMPVVGKVVRAFGRRYDAASSLYTFHKGIDIETSPGTDVRAVYDGKIVYMGRLGGYGQLLILDHGNQYYSLIGHLGEVLKREGDSVVVGDVLGRTERDGTPLYFEIRQRHVAVNPVPWLAMKH